MKTKRKPGRVEALVRCFFGLHQWERSRLQNLNALPGETSWYCTECLEYKRTFDHSYMTPNTKLSGTASGSAPATGSRLQD